MVCENHTRVFLLFFLPSRPLHHPTLPLIRSILSLPRSPSNPQGWIPLVVAENKLNNDLILNRMNQVHSFPTWVMNYGGFKGTIQLQSSFATLLNRTFVPREPVLDPNNFCILSGCTGVLEALFYCLGDEGQTVLIPAPYYPAFDNDTEARAHLIPTPFFLNTETITKVEGQENDVFIIKQLDGLKAEAEEQHRPLCALLITNPNNPLGTIYSDETVLTMIEWCMRNDIHYISDEIYALSVYGSEERGPFVSALTLAQQLVANNTCTQHQVDTYVHLIYGMSKDWCGSGLRVGALYSRNQPLQQALMSLAGFSGISLHTQHILSEVLADEEFTSNFVAHNQASLRDSYSVLSSALKAAGIPFVEAVAGMFVWVDLRQWLTEKSWEGEAVLWQRVCDECKVILTPGKDCHAPEPGYFRVCFAWVQKEALEEAINRLVATVLTG